MKALDLFCGVGGTARGLLDEGYDVVGFDVEPQPHYPGEFHQRDLRDGLPEWVHAETWAVVWASPPCQFRTRIAAFRSGENLIPLARDLVNTVNADARIIENVPGAQEFLRAPVVLEGGAFGLGLEKRRVFETNFQADSRLAPGTQYEFCIGDREAPVQEYREAHGFDRDADLPTKDVREAIPPAYVSYLLDSYHENGTSVQVAITDGGSGTAENSGGDDGQ